MKTTRRMTREQRAKERLTKKQKKLVEAHIPLAKHVCKLRWRTSKLRRDEVLAACYYGLVRAALTYKPSKAAFSTHAWRRIHGAIDDEVRRKYKTRRSRPMPVLGDLRMPFSIEAGLEAARGDYVGEHGSNLREPVVYDNILDRLIEKEACGNW